MFKLNTFISNIMAIEPVRRQSIASFIAQISFTFIGFLSTMYFAHTVGASILGAYFLFTAYFGIINMVTDGGFGRAAIKRISEGEEQDAYFSAFFVVRSLFAVIVIATLIIFRKHFVDLNSSGIFIWFLLALIVSQFKGFIFNGVAGRGKMGIFATGNFIDNTSRVLIQIAAIFLGFGIVGLMGGFVIGMISATISILHFFDLRIVFFKWKHVKSLSTFSFWLFLTSAGVMLYTYSDSIMIGYYMGNVDVGVYRIAFQFTTVAAIVTSAFRSTLWPKISRWGKTGEIKCIEESLSRALNYSLILPIPIFIGGALLGDRLLYFFYGAEFVRGYTVLVILLFVQIINIFQFFFTMYLGGLDYQKESFKVTGFAGVANIILNFLLIPVIGIIGAAIATMVTMSLNAILARKKLSQIMIIRIDYGSILNILKASSVMFLFVGSYRLLIPLSNVWLTLVPVILGGMIYVVLILKFDRKIFKELKGIMMQMSSFD